MGRERHAPPTPERLAQQRELNERAHAKLDRLGYRVSEVVDLAEAETEDGRRFVVLRLPSGATVRRNGDPVWTRGNAGDDCRCCFTREGARAGHALEPCLSCGLATGARSPGGYPFCHEECRAIRHGLVDRSDRRRANEHRVPGLAVGRGGGPHVAAVAKLLRAGRDQTRQRALVPTNPDPVGAARERDALADRQGQDIETEPEWAEGRE